MARWRWRRKQPIGAAQLVLVVSLSLTTTAGLANTIPRPLYNATAEEQSEIGAAMPEGKAELTVRQVTQILFKARRGEAIDLSSKSLKNLDLSGLDLKAAKLAHSDLWGVDLTGSNLSGVDLSGARLNRASITQTDFSYANLSGATILRPTVHRSFAYDWKDAPRFTGANLVGLRVMARLDGSDFRRADLSKAQFTAYEPRPGQGTLTTRAGNDLLGCDFSGAKLIEADFTNAGLMFSRFVGSDLTRAKFVSADLSKVDFTGADLTGADLTGADLDGAILTGVKGLETVIGLNSAQHVDSIKR